MGVQKLFRFITRRYPATLSDIRDGFSCDYLYLDMNAMIHEHARKEANSPHDVAALFAALFDDIDRLYRFILPTKLLFLAVDGVAPRAKMNQQRRRRFMSARAADRSERHTARPSHRAAPLPFDSNCITPGTRFMQSLRRRFREWLDHKIDVDPTWRRGCSVFFSGPDVPGEGEHKIMDYLRHWQRSKDFNAQSRHCVVGMDSDLLLLGLVSRVQHFSLLSKKPFVHTELFGSKRRCTDAAAADMVHVDIGLLRRAIYDECVLAGIVSRDISRRDRSDSSSVLPDVEQGLTTPSSHAVTVSHLSLANRNRNMDDMNGVCDDFVFLVSLVGNDYLPRVPHLTSADLSIAYVFDTYMRLLPYWGGYLTCRNSLHYGRLESLFAELGKSECAHFDRNATDPMRSKYRQLFYSRRFDFDVKARGSSQILHKLREDYMYGLHWILNYYHLGVLSWRWFYPEDSVPLANDLRNLNGLQVSFPKDDPFSPLMQLLAVLPPRSAMLLPRAMQPLMLEEDSPIIDFYPEEFRAQNEDGSGATAGRLELPFIDERRVEQVISEAKTSSALSNSELARDEFGVEVWFHPLGRRTILSQFHSRSHLVCR